MKKKNHSNKHLTTMRSYRFSPLMAHSLYATARSRELTESEFVRMILMDALERLD